MVTNLKIENFNKKDVTELIQSMNNPVSQKAAVAHLCLDFVKLQNIDAKKCKPLQSIMIEICFGQQKVQSHITSSLGFTKNKHFFGEKF